jgi:hypothetical protein
MISTLNIPDDNAGSVSKVLQPGNHIVTINSVKLETPAYNANAYNLVLGLEGPDMGEGFDGFFISKDNESLGRHKGQVAFVKMSQYAYADGTTKTGISIKRDVEIVKALKNICRALNCLDWYHAEDMKHETIESLINKFNEDKPFTGSTLRCCIGGSEYTNKQGYTNYDLYFVKPGRGQYAYESGNTPESSSNIVSFDPDIHIRRKKVDTVQSFGDSGVTTSSSVGSDFDL